MKKVFLMVLCLCMLCTAAFAEDVIELNWEQYGTEEAAAQGEFQKLEIPDVATVLFWIPSVLNATDPGVVEGPFQPTALYVSEDEKYGVAVFLNDIGSASLEDYAKMMETEGGGSNFRNVMINGVSCVGYEIEENDMECLIYPVTSNVIVTFTCTPLNGDEGWDATKGVIFASIQFGE